MKSGSSLYQPFQPYQPTDVTVQQYPEGEISNQLYRGRRHVLPPTQKEIQYSLSTPKPKPTKRPLDYVKKIRITSEYNPWDPCNNYQFNIKNIKCHLKELFG